MADNRQVSSQPQQEARVDPSRPPQETGPDPAEIVSQMTVEEKASLCSGQDFWHTKSIERLGVPSFMLTDGPHGLRKQDEGADHLGIHQSVPATCFPTACATACSFDRDLMRQIGAAIGRECRHEGVTVVLWGQASTSSVARCAGATSSTSARTRFSPARWPLR